MSGALRVAGYVLRDVARGRWLLAYALVLFAGSEGMLRLSGGPEGALAALTSLLLLVLPLVGLLYGIGYLHSSRDFVGLLLAQPIGRVSLFAGMYGGLALALSLAFLLGCGVPLALHGTGEAGAAGLLLAGGVLLTCTFLSLAFLTASMVAERVRALGAAVVVWLFYAILFDGLLLLALARWADYPLERPLMAALLLNPLDLARVLVLLRLDAAALLGYTGAVFQEFFGRALGTGVALLALGAWAAVPLAWALRRFRRADF